MSPSLLRSDLKFLFIFFLQKLIQRQLLPKKKFLNFLKIWLTLISNFFLIAITCGTNQIYDTRKNCQPTCLHQDGNYDCGELKKVEGCFCKSGYVLDSKSRCVAKENCGCKLQDNSTVIGVGQTLISKDCAYTYTCPSAGAEVVTTENNCAQDSVCVGDANNQAVCKCKDGYFGNGKECYLGMFIGLGGIIIGVRVRVCEFFNRKLKYSAGTSIKFYIYLCEFMFFYKKFHKKRKNTNRQIFSKIL